MITRETEEQATVLPDGQMQVLKITKLMEDGKEIGREPNHRRVIAPGDDITAEVGIVKEVADKIHTKARKDTYKAKLIEINDIATKGV